MHKLGHFWLFLFLVSALAKAEEIALPCSPQIDLPPTLNIKFNEAAKDAEGNLSIPSLGKIYFSRNSTATYFDSQGVMRVAAVNKPRIEYHPFLCQDLNADTVINPNCPRRLRGLLIEEWRTNLLSDSHDLTQWNASQVMVAKNAAGLDNVSGSAVTVSLGQTNSGKISTTALIKKGPSYTFSFYVRDVHPAKAFAASTSLRPPRMKVSFTWGNQVISTGTIDVRSQYVIPNDLRLANPTGGYRYSEVEPVGKDWYRVSITLDYWLLATRLTAGVEETATINIELNADAATSKKVVLFGAQFEAGKFASSLIPTSGSPAVRDGEVAQVFPWKAVGQFPWYADTQGNFAIQADQIDSSSAAGYLLELGYHDGDRQIFGIDYGKTYHTFFHAKPTPKITRYESAAGSLNSGERFNASFGYMGSSDGSLYVRHAVDGGATVRPDDVFQLPMPTGLRYLTLATHKNRGFPRFLNGHLLAITYRNQILSLEDQIQASSLGCKPSFASLRSVPAMSDECDTAAVPEYISGRWNLHNKWDVNSFCGDEGHILSYRCQQDVAMEGGYCKLFTHRTSDLTPAGDKIWRTGSTHTKTTLRYGYFEAAYKNRGVPIYKTDNEANGKRTPLNNAFWLFTKGWNRNYSLSEIDCEIDINEGRYPNKVMMTVHNHREFVGPKILSKTNNGRSWRHPVTAAGDSNSLSSADHVYALSWTRQEISWYVDNQLVRRTPNHYCHRDMYLYMSSAIMEGQKGDTMKDVDPDLDGKNLEFKFIRTFKP